MPPTKTPTSSLSGNHTPRFPSLHLAITTTTVFELLIKRVWYRTLAAIWRVSSGGAPPETSTRFPSPATRLPLEVVQMIVANLTNSTRSLLACSLTCRSWYIAAVPHLHHTLTTSTWYMCEYAKLEWPKPLRNAHRLGLLPFVKKFQIQRRDPQFFSGFSPKRFNCWTLRHFLALTNVQELGIDHLDIPSFMSSIQLYFGHFLPTLRSLALGEPKGTRRQIIYFIGLFRHLEDLKILYDKPDPQEGPEGDVTLIPSFIPPLRGQLTMCSTGVGLSKDMINLFGGIRFRYLDIFNVSGTQPLLGACAGTLETLRLYPNDPRGKEHFRGNVRVLTIPQLPALRTFIYSETSRFEHLSSECDILMLQCGLVRRFLPRASS